MLTRLFVIATAIGSLALLPAAVNAQAVEEPTSTYCPDGTRPYYVNGFDLLYNSLGTAALEIIGRPRSCEVGNPDGSGDTIQFTTQGFFYYRAATNTVTFTVTDGGMHWALKDDTVFYWYGDSVDMPTGVDS